MGRTSVLSWFALAGCHPGKDLVLAPGDTGLTETTPPGLAIAGVYTDEYGATHEIDEATWVQRFPAPFEDTWTFTVTQHDNAGEFLVAQNGAENPYSAGLWSRFDWTWPDHLYYCQTVYDAEVEQDAADASRADAADLDAGCGGFAWTDLTP